MPVYLTGVLLIIATLLSDVWITVDWRVAANVGLVLLAVFVTVFTTLYGWRSRWMSSRIGKVFLVKGVTFSLVLWQIVAATWLDTDYPGRQQLRFIIYGFGAVAYMAMVVALWREQRGDKRRKEARDRALSRGE